MFDSAGSKGNRGNGNGCLCESYLKDIALMDAHFDLKKKEKQLNLHYLTFECSRFKQYTLFISKMDKECPIAVLARTQLIGLRERKCC